MINLYCILLCPHLNLPQDLKNIHLHLLQDLRNVRLNYNISCTGISTACTDGQCHKSLLWMGSNSEKTKLSLVKYSFKIMMKIATKDTSLKLKYLKEQHNPRSDLPFLPARMRIEKYQKIVTNPYSKKNYAIHIKTLKQAINHGLKL